MSLADTPVIRTDKLSRSFGETVAVRDLSLTVHSGEIFGLLGHNGAGKTTTVRLLNGILTPSKGTVRVFELNPAVDGPALRRQTGVLTETPGLDEKLTAEENLRFYGRLYGVPDTKLSSRIAELLEEFGLDDRATEPVGGYSKGMRQRLAFARTLIHAPRLLFLDEPTAGLDPVGRRAVHDLIVSLSQSRGRTICMCTHDLMEAQKLCHRVGVMEQGSLVALGTPEALARELQHGVRLKIELATSPPDEVINRRHRPDKGCEFIWHEDNHHASVRLLTREAIPELVADLVTHDARIYRVTPQEPTLEDVYFALHDRGAPPQSLGDRP